MTALPRNKGIFYSTLAYLDNTEQAFSDTVYVPDWASHMTFMVNATHAGTFDIYWKNPVTSIFERDTDGPFASVARGSSPQVIDPLKFDAVPGAAVRIRWTSGTSASGNVDAGVYFGRGGLR